MKFININKILDDISVLYDVISMKEKEIILIEDLIVKIYRTEEQFVRQTLCDKLPHTIVPDERMDVKLIERQLGIFKLNSVINGVHDSIYFSYSDKIEKYLHLPINSLIESSDLAQKTNLSLYQKIANQQEKLSLYENATILDRIKYLFKGKL